MFLTKADSYQDIFWGSVWSCVSLSVWKKSEFLRSHILALSLNWVKFVSFQLKWILMKTFVECQFSVISVYEFHTKRNSSEDIYWVSVWNYATLSVSNQSQFAWRHLLSLNLKLSMFMSFKQKRFLMKTFLEAQFEVI